MGRNHGETVDVDNVRKAFGTEGDRPFIAVEGVSLRLAGGEFVSIVGPSGCGKSTLMLMVAGLLRPTAGEVRIGGRRLSGPVTDVGIAFQDHLLLDFRTAIDNVLLQAAIRRLPMAPLKERAKQLFAQLGIETAMDKYPRQLSGGMQQRVNIARALVHDPPLLLMDEPFASLDALTRMDIRGDLEALWMDRQPTVLFITHNVEEAVGLSDRVVVMSASPGQILEIIDVDLSRPRPLSTGSSPKFGAYVERILEHFERSGVLRRRGALGK